jgi:hypothetical protein
MGYIDASGGTHTAAHFTGATPLMLLQQQRRGGKRKKATPNQNKFTAINPVFSR